MDSKRKLKDIECRTCFHGTKGLRSLTGLVPNEKPHKSYADVLMELANINIMEDKCKEITQYICGSCSRKLKAAYVFIKQVQELNTQFLTMLDQDDSSRKEMDFLQESQIDIESCLEIKLEYEDIEGTGQVELPQCDAQIKLEMPEENILNITTDSLDTNIEGILDKINLEKTNSTNFKQSIEKFDEEITDEDALNIEANNTNTNFEDYNNDYLSKDSHWQEYFNKSLPKVVKQTPKSDKPELDKSDIEDDIVVPYIESEILQNFKALTIHKSTNHIPEEEKSCCPLCGRSFSKRGNMYKHMREIHGPETLPFMRIHTSEDRPYQCGKCSCKYGKKKSLKAHMKIKHSQEIENNENENLTDQPSSQERPYQCDKCSRNYGKKKYLKAHMKIKHSNENEINED